MIRNANLSDIPQLLIIGKKFFDESGYVGLIEYDEESTENTLHSLIESDVGLLVVYETDGKVQGAAGGMVYPFYFNNNHITGSEFFWWIDPKLRGSKAGVKLFKALEETAKDKGAETFSMIALDRLNPELVGRIYEKRGYRKSEHTYIRSL